MTTLVEAIRARIEDEGLTVEEDRGGLLVRGGSDDQAVSIWLDETDRVIRAEEVITYPVDDFSPALGQALARLNQARVGVSYAYQESQRAVVAASVWTSPTRDVSANQAHLMLALLHEAKGRDGAILARVADGDAGPDDVLEDDDPLRLASSRFDRGRAGAPTRHYDVFAEQGSPAREDAPEDAGWAEPPTRPLGKISEMDYAAYDSGDEVHPGADYEPEDEDGGWEADPAWDEALATRAEDGPPEPPRQKPERRHHTELPPSDPLAAVQAPERPRATSRHALQLAISAVENREHEQQDLTTERRSLKRRLLRSTAILIVVLGVGYVLFDRIVRPLAPDAFAFDVDLDLGEWFATATLSEDERQLREREALQPGAALLRLELEQPLPGREGSVQDCLTVLGEQAQATLETLLVSAATEQARLRAYELWREGGYGEDPAALLPLMRQLQALRDPRDRVLRYVLTALRKTPPTDEAIIAALDGLPQGAAWQLLVKRLGRPGEGAEARAAALSALLEHDSADNAALRALIETGHAPPAAIERLVTARGMDWAREAGWPLLLALVRERADVVEALLRSSEEEVRALGLDLLAESQQPETAGPILARTLRDSRLPTRLRLRAAIALGHLGAADVTWELVLVLNRKDEEQAVVDEVRRALRKLPEAGAVAQLNAHLASDRAGERYYAVRGLAALRGPAAAQALIDLLQREPEARIRQYVLRVLELQQKQADLRSSLNVGLGTYRSLARSDPDAQVRALARRLYMSLTGHEP